MLGISQSYISRLEKKIMIRLKKEIVKLTNTSDETVRRVNVGLIDKDDDLTLATMYMNEFMNLVDNYVSNRYGVPTPTIERVYSIGD